MLTVTCGYSEEFVLNYSHNENVSTYNDPRNQLDVEYEYAETRIISLTRDPQLGFGFVAGSERPVVVRCVTEGELANHFDLHKMLFILLHHVFYAYFESFPVNAPV